MERIRVAEVTSAAERASLATNEQGTSPAGLGGVEALDQLAHHHCAHRVQLVGAIEHQFGHACEPCGAGQIPAYGGRSLPVRIFSWLAQTVTPF